MASPKMATYRAGYTIFRAQNKSKLQAPFFKSKKYT